MIKKTYKVAKTHRSFLAKSQEQVFDHWLQIAKNKRYPVKKDFRPQNFPKYLPQLAVIAVDAKNTFTERLVGNTVSEVFRHADGRTSLVMDIKKQATCIMHEILCKCASSELPLYFQGKLLDHHTSPPLTDKGVDFNVLVLPFSLSVAADRLSSFLLAFDFSKRIQLDAALAS